MTRKLLTLALAGVLLAVLIVSSPTRPAEAIDPTLDAAVVVIAQATARAAQVQAAQRATAAALSAEATRQAQNVKATAAALSAEATRQAQSIAATATAQAFAVQSTAQAQSAQATQSAMDELTRQRAMTATSQAQSIAATRTMQDELTRQRSMTAAAQAQNAKATATSQAVAIVAQATDAAQLSQTYATRQDRFTWGLLAVEIFFLLGAAWVLWKLTGTLAAWAVKLHPQIERPMSDLIAASATAQAPAGSVVIEQEHEPAPRMPSFVTVNNDPRFVEALDRWAERYDAHLTVSESGEHGGNNGNG
jgi:hypothetical protein